MFKMKVKTTDGCEIEISDASGRNLMELAVENGVDGIVGECGGQAMCATCHVYVEEKWMDKIPARSDIEDELLECVEGDLKDNSRLCCQIILDETTDGICIEVPSS